MKVAVDSLFHPRDLSLCVPSPWECHASLLYFKMLQKVPLFFCLFQTHTKLFSVPPAVKILKTRAPGSQVQCNLA